MQGNGRHVAQCAQLHWSWPRGSLTDQVSQFLSFPFLLTLLEQDKTLKGIALSQTISQTSQVLADKRREQTGSHHNYNKEGRACAPPTEVPLHGLTELTGFKWLRNYGWVISIHLPQLNPGLSLFDLDSVHSLQWLQWSLCHESTLYFQTSSILLHQTGETCCHHAVQRSRPCFPDKLDPLVLLYRAGQMCGRGKSRGIKKTEIERKQRKEKDWG